MEGYLTQHICSTTHQHRSYKLLTKPSLRLQRREHLGLLHKLEAGKEVEGKVKEDVYGGNAVVYEGAL
jgi:hypothetical protein